MSGTADPEERGTAFELLGSRCVIRCRDPQAASELERLLGVFRVDDEREPDLELSVERRGEELVVSRDDRMVGDTRSPAHAVALVMAHLNAEVVDRSPALAVHAGAVASGRRVVALPGPSQGGKSTLTAACLQAGFSYVTDEALCLDLVEGRVIPYRKPLALSKGSRKLLGLEGKGTADGELLFTPHDLGSRYAEDDLSLAEVVVAARATGGAELEQLPSAQVAAALLAFSFNHYRYGEAAFRLATELSRGARAWRLHYQDPREAAELLWKRLG